MKKLLFLIAATAIFSLTLSSCGDKQKESLPAAPAVQPSETDQILKAQEEVLRLQQKQVDIIKNNEKIAENQKFLRPDCGDCEEKVVKKPCPPVKKPIIAKPKPPCCVEKPAVKQFQPKVGDCITCKMLPFPSEYKKYSKWELLDPEGCYGFESPFITGEHFKFKTKQEMQDFWYTNKNYFGKYAPNNF